MRSVIVALALTRFLGLLCWLSRQPPRNKMGCESVQASLECEQGKCVAGK